MYIYIKYNISIKCKDIVNLVNVLRSGSSDECIGDMNGDGILNVLDVVALVNAVLNGNE